MPSSEVHFFRPRYMIKLALFKFILVLCWQVSVKNMTW